MSITVPMQGFGGGVPLNFKVVGNPKPTNPKENTIWLNTDEKITGYYFQEKQPENMQNGEVFVATGSKSNASFNALKKNGITVYPLKAQQMVSGTLKDVEAKIYKGGKWTDWWSGELYQDGNEYEFITGGWKSEGKQASSNSTATAKAPTITRNDTSIKFAITTAKVSGIARTVNKVDLSDFSKIVVSGNLYNGEPYATMMKLAVFSTIGTYYEPSIVAYKDIAARTSVTNVELDVGNINSECYVGFIINTANGSSNSYIDLESCLLVR